MKSLRAVLVSSFLLWVHLALVLYMHSSMLGTFLSPTQVSTLFAFGSCVSIVLILSLPRIINTFGVTRVTALLFLIEGVFCYVLGTTTNSNVIIPIFIGYFSLTGALVYMIDLLVEHYSTDQNTGNIRGILLTINNAALVIIPFFIGKATGRYGFSLAYLLAAIALCFAGIVVAITQRSLKTAQYTIPKLRDAFMTIKNSPSIRRIISVNFLLQFFFSWMVVYVPLYLTKELLLPWSTVGVIISLMLLPFVLFQYGAGRIADKYLGEKELLIGALIIAGLSTIFFAFIGPVAPLYLAIVLFCTRVGASIVEVMCDSYLFKHVSETDTNTISFYRTMQPFAYVLGPLTGAIIVTYLSFTALFTILGIIMLLGVLYAVRIVNTR